MGGRPGDTRSTREPRWDRVPLTHPSHLLDHFDKMTETLKNTQNGDVICTDLTKISDKHGLRVTVKKMRKMGTTGRVERCINNFLKKSQHIVSHSKEKVPQGNRIYTSAVSRSHI